LSATTVINSRVHDPRFVPLVRAFDRLVTGNAGGGALVVRRGGETLVDLIGGTSDLRGTRPWTRETLALSFSTTKGVASTVIHRLTDRGLIDYDEPVATYWPAFGTGGKFRVTVRDLMTHRAGLASVRSVARSAEEILDHEAMETRLAARAPIGTPTPHSAYHALTYGWLLSGLARAVTGRDMAELFQTEIAEPLGTDGLHLGAPPDARERVAAPVGGALRQLSAAAGASNALWSRLPAARRPIHALLIPGFHRLFEGDDPLIWGAQMPAVNGAFSADGLARMYGALANGGSIEGRALLSPSRTADIGRVQIRSADAVLGLRMRWRLGYHHAFGTGRDASMAFGHYGYGGSGGWADPATGISLGFVTNRIGSLTTPLGDLNLFRLSALARRCALMS
jgi:CubicO group peptidase (beta-lactamase class C family)